MNDKYFEICKEPEEYIPTEEERKKFREWENSHHLIEGDRK